MSADRPRLSLPVLTFHAVDEVRSPVSTTPAGLRGYLASLAAQGWRTLTMDEALQGHARGGWPARAFLLTFDDGYRSVLEQAASVVAEHGFTATVFVPSGLVGGTMRRYGAPAGTPVAPLLDWPALKTLSSAGWTIGSHSRTHAMLTALPGVEAERGSEREPVLDNRSIRADQKRQGTKEPRRDTRECATLADALAGKPEMTGSERPQSAVRGLLMIERRAAAKVPGLDERDAQASARCVVGRGEPVDSPAHDEQIELVGVEP